MSLETLIDPRCRVPTYLQTDAGIVERCGKLGGYTICIFLTLIVVVMSWYYYSKAIPVTMDKEEVERAKQRKIFIFVVSFISLLIIWLGIPVITGYISTREYQGYNHEINQLINQGYDRKTAIAQVQSLYQSQQQADAIRSVGSQIRSSNSVDFSGVRIRF